MRLRDFLEILFLLAFVALVMSVSICEYQRLKKEDADATIRNREALEKQKGILWPQGR